MNVLCLGGAGRICREAILDLVQTSDFDRITVANTNEVAGREVVPWVNDPRVDFVVIDVFNKDATVALMWNYDLVMDGTPRPRNWPSIQSTFSRSSRSDRSWSTSMAGQGRDANATAHSQRKRRSQLR